MPMSLREKLGDEDTDSLEERFAKRLAEEMGKLRSEIYNEMGKLRSEMHDEIGKLRAEMHDEIGKLRGDIIKWMFIFWIGQFIALAGLLFAMVKPLK